MTHRTAKVLLVEDAPTVRTLLVDALERDPALRVIGAVATGEEALRFLVREKPDVILMDIHLPGIDGFETTRQIMQSRPVPIVICSAVADPQDVAIAFEAMDAGAVAVLAKPAGLGAPGAEAALDHLVETVRLMADVKVIRRWNRSRPLRPPATAPSPAVAGAPPPPPQVIAIGTSTGGPPVLRTILAGLPRDLPVPVLVVQHIAPGFLPGLVEWLAKASALPIQISTHGDPPLPGRVYFAPDGFHLGFGARGQLRLTRPRPDDCLCPSVAFLFDSIGETFGAAAIGVLLTGMGKDGAVELANLRRRGAITIAQDRESSVVHGMPGEAIRLNGAAYILPAGEIPVVLRRFFANP